MTREPLPAVAWKIHPGIGFARVGNAPSDYVLGPEALEPRDPSAFGRKDSGDPAALLLPAIRRQAARFRVYAYDAEGHCLGEVTAASVKAIEWSVGLANRKASGRRIGRGIGDDAGRQRIRLRNKDIPDPERWRLEITPRPRQVAGINQRAVFDDGRFMEIPVCLGEIRTDGEGRLLVLGGSGRAGTWDAARRIRSFTDNDGWYDDVADGPVRATLTLPDGRVVAASPAWVVVTPPDFAPGIQGPATQFDVWTDYAIRRGWRARPARPSFREDILPILRRIAAMQWMDARALQSFGGLEIEARLAGLALNSAASQDARGGVFAEIAAHCRLLGLDRDDDAPAMPGDRWLKLTRTQFELLRLWADGAFDADWPRPAIAAGAAPSPERLDRAALEACAGGVLLADGVPVGERDFLLPGDGLRFDPDKVSAGSITQGMACPWQADFIAASAPWSPSACPGEVMTAATHAALCGIDEEIAALAADGSAEEQRDALQMRRAALWKTRHPWWRGLAAGFPAREEGLVKEWQHLGFVAPRRPGAGGTACWVETERSPHIATMGEYFYRLVNFEENLDFAPKALELAQQMLGDAKFSADEKYAPFDYTPEAFDAHMDRMYAELVQSDMYKPLSWESGEISWNAIVDYDEDDEPVWKTRRFHVGRLSDKAVRERFRQFAPQNMTDGAWLQNVISAAPMDGIQSRLASIWIDEAGSGRADQNHSNVYAALMHSLNIYLPPVTSREFIEQDFVRSAFEGPVFQFCVGRFPRRFLPELLGMTLYMEWEATPTSVPIANMMAGRRIDPQYYRMHAAVDNISVGHGALAKEAIKLYLHARHQEGGDAAVQEHWKRIWRGYVAWATLGNGADEILERILIVDKKQIHLGSSLLQASDILPPLIAAVKAADDPVSRYLGTQLDPSTRLSLAEWSIGEAPPERLLEGLRRDLNRCLRAGIYDQERFTGVPQSGDTARLLKLQPTHGVDLIDLGRCLLEDAYPAGIRRRTGFPDIQRHYAARMAEVIRSKLPVALQSHRRVGWLAEAFKGGPETVMRRLLERGFIDIDHPGRSRLFGKTEFDGPMYKVFTEEERAAMIDWIESLRAGTAGAVRPEPVLVADAAGMPQTAAAGGTSPAQPVREVEWSFGEKRSRIGMGSVH